ncbi:MAG: hypothetical protein R3338_12365 [Thermoanaerobaculia bacterium]|nr:hypothetical protein [Thermoanaerobaculia bacterium]
MTLCYSTFDVAPLSDIGSGAMDTSIPLETSTGDFLVEIDETSIGTFSTPAAVLDCLEQLSESRSGAVTVWQDMGSRPWWQRFLGLGARDLNQRLALQWCEDAAALIFFDDDAGEHRVLDRDHPVHASEDVRLRLSHGESSPAPPEECMPTDRSWLAIREFMLSGRRPRWLSYRHVP